MRILAAMFVLAASAPALAAPTGPAGPAGVVAAEQQPDHIVCRRPIKVGTLIGPRRACRLQSEWRMMRGGRPAEEQVAEDRDRLETLNERLTTGNLGGNDHIPQ